MEQNRNGFISAMRQVASGVTVVTTDGPGGRAGLTVSAMCSLSADPPSLLVCIHRQSRAVHSLRTNGVFCVNVLSAEQVEVARIFGGQNRADTPDKFDCARWHRMVTGSPAFCESLAVFDCNLTQGMQFGSHDVMIGVVAESCVRAGLPLIYANRAYGQVASLAWVAPEAKRA